MAKQFPRDIIVATIATVIASALYAAAQLFLPAQGIAVVSLAIAVAFLGALVVIFAWPKFLHSRAFTPLRRQIETEMSEQLEETARVELAQELQNSIGLVRIHANFPACEHLVKESIGSSDRIDIFVQIGKTVFADSNFYDYLRGANVPGAASMRLLHADADSVFLTEKAAQSRGNDVQSWRLDLKYSYSKAVSLESAAGKSVEARQHQEGYLWRLFVFDNVAFAQPYLYDRDNSSLAPVLEFARNHDSANKVLSENPRSLYRVFSRYFDLVWDKSAPEQTSFAGWSARMPRWQLSPSQSTRAGSCSPYPSAIWPAMKRYSSTFQGANRLIRRTRRTPSKGKFSRRRDALW